jgi:hypothetical protein
LWRAKITFDDPKYSNETKVDCSKHQTLLDNKCFCIFLCYHSSLLFYHPFSLSSKQPLHLGLVITHLQASVNIVNLKLITPSNFPNHYLTSCSNKPCLKQMLQCGYINFHKSLFHHLPMFTNPQHNHRTPLPMYNAVIIHKCKKTQVLS